MKNIERSGVDIRVALSSSAKLVSTQAADMTATQAAHGSSGASPSGLRAMIKRAIKPVVRVFFRIIRPFVSPLAFRSRAYMATPVVAEIHQIRQQLGKDLAAHKRAQQEATERLLATHTASLLREIKASQEALRSLTAARGTDTLIRRLLQPAGTFAEFGAHAVVQGSIDVLRLDAARVEPSVLAGLTSVMSDNPHLALIVDFEGSLGPDLQRLLESWRQAAKPLGLIATAIDPRSGTLRETSTRRPGDEAPNSLLMAREGANAWRRARDGVMRSVVVVGAGGHAKVCIELLRAMGMSIAFCIDGARTGDGLCLDVPVLHGDEHLARLRGEGHAFAFIAIGANALRQRLAASATALGYELVNAISPAAVVSPTVRLGKGIAIMAGAVVNADTAIADLAIINTCASVDHDGRIGEAAHVAPHCGLAGNVTVGARAFLGIGCKAIPGVSIGRDAVAGAGSIIISDVEPNTRVVGVPARKLNERG